MVVVRWPALPLRSNKGSVPFWVTFWANKKELAEGTNNKLKIIPHLINNHQSIFYQQTASYSQ
jgi:hypothetical protein